MKEQEYIDALNGILIEPLYAAAYDAGKRDAIRDLGTAKDEAAEREHREHARIVCTEMDLNEATDELMNERASARAEVAAKYHAMLVPKDEESEIELCCKLARAVRMARTTLQSADDQIRATRAAARVEGYAAGQIAERELLAAAYEEVLAEARVALKTVREHRDELSIELEAHSQGARKLQGELDTANAEITKLRNVLSTRLANLREAAERMVHWTIGITDSECRDIVGALHAAIEASKK